MKALKILLDQYFKVSAVWNLNLLSLINSSMNFRWWSLSLCLEGLRWFLKPAIRRSFVKSLLNYFTLLALTHLSYAISSVTLEVTQGGSETQFYYLKKISVYEFQLLACSNSNRSLNLTESHRLKLSLDKIFGRLDKLQEHLLVCLACKSEGFN